MKEYVYKEKENNKLYIDYNEKNNLKDLNFLNI